MKKLLLAGALILTVACQKETIEEQANDFVSVEKKTGIANKTGEGQTHWELGEGYSSDIYGYSGDTYITSYHSITTDNVEMDIAVTIRGIEDDFHLYYVAIGTGNGVAPNYEKNTGLYSACQGYGYYDCDFSFNTDTGEFYFNGRLGVGGNFNVEFKGKVLDMDSELRQINYRQISAGDQFSLSINDFTSSAPIETGPSAGFTPIHPPGGYEFWVHPDYYVEFRANNFSENDHIEKFRLYYLTSGEILWGEYYVRHGEGFIWTSSQTGDRIDSYLTSNIAAILYLY